MKSEPTPERKQEAPAPAPKSNMTSEQAATMILAPYVTEKTFNQIEKENKLAFIVTEKATKKQIIEAINMLYEADIEEVNTTRTIRGKKAGFSIEGHLFLVRFKSGMEVKDRVI